MSTPSRLRVLVVALGLAAACGPRQVEVRTAPATASEQTVQVTNNLSQPVNVYVTAGDASEQFLRQVPPNTVEKVPVPSVARGAMATFKAVTVDNSRTYRSRSVALSGLFLWSVP